MNLPSFLWLWKIAAWSMGFTLIAYLLLAITGTSLFYLRYSKHQRPRWLRPLHYITGGVMIGLVLILLGVGLVGTIGYYGNLGHSIHLAAGLTVVILVIISAWSSTQISIKKTWARPVHIGTNLLLLGGLLWVTLTGWTVVQKYLP